MVINFYKLISISAHNTWAQVHNKQTQPPQRHLQWLMSKWVFQKQSLTPAFLQHSTNGTKVTKRIYFKWILLCTYIVNQIVKKILKLLSFFSLLFFICFLAWRWKMRHKIVINTTRCDNFEYIAPHRHNMYIYYNVVNIW